MDKVKLRLSRVMIYYASHNRRTTRIAWVSPMPLPVRAVVLCQKGWFLPRVREAEAIRYNFTRSCLSQLRLAPITHTRRTSLLLNDLYARLLPPPLQVETLTLEDHGPRLSHKNFTCLSNASNLLGQSA